MAKCVKLSDGNIERVSDKRARELVKGGKGSYCPKKEWKKQKGS